jgi:hypothetical protein
VNNISSCVAKTRSQLLRPPMPFWERPDTHGAAADETSSSPMTDTTSAAIQYLSQSTISHARVLRARHVYPFVQAGAVCFSLANPRCTRSPVGDHSPPNPPDWYRLWMQGRTPGNVVRRHSIAMQQIRSPWMIRRLERQS